MNLHELHPADKAISALSLFKAEEGNVLALQILADQTLKEHITKVPALLLCIKGEVVFKNEKGIEEKLLPGDYVKIEAMVKHWVNGIQDSDLILVK